MTVRTEFELLPEFTAELEEIRNSGITTELLYKIIQKHQFNAIYNKSLHNRYKGLNGCVPIFNRKPRYEEEKPINNKINNDYFGLIINAKTGCFAGNPFSYSYSITDEAEEDTGGKNEVEIAKRTLSDFITRNNMHQKDMQVTKNSATYGYSGRLAYIDEELNERIMTIHGYETIILSDVDISEPEYAVRYYTTLDINGAEVWTAIFYDNKYATTYKGASLLDLTEVEKKEHLFDYCPLWGVANNEECMGDAEKVLQLIDAYDMALSDNANEIDAFTHALMQIGVNIDDEYITKAQKTGVLVIPQVGSNPVSEPVKWVTKNINDTFTEHHLERINENIFTFSQTPNFLDEKFGNVSGVALEQKFNGMREKCTAFKASFMNASHYMWKVICSSWRRKGINIDPLHIVTDVKFNIPQDLEGEARTVQTLIGAGLPKRYAFAKLSDVDDVEWVLDEIEAEKEEATDVTNLYDDVDINDTGDNKDPDNADKPTEEELNAAKSGGKA